MLEFLRTLFSGDPFMPHIHCFLGNRGLTMLHVSSDALIGLSYVAISATLAYLVYRGRRDIPFHSMFLAFGAFIIACGITHFMAIWTLWTPSYWLSGGIKGITAAASVITAIALPPLVPITIKMIQDANLSERRREAVEAAHAELNRVYERLKEFDDLKTQFFANVSHELRTPLTLIIGPSERLLVDPELRPDQRRALEAIRRNAQSLLLQVNDLLDVSRMESGEMSVRYAAVDLAHVVRATTANFESLAQDREIELTVNAPPQVHAQVDPEKLQRILMNLVGNALKFTPDGGVIRMELEERLVEDGSSRAVLQVRDSGPGVPVEHRAAVFERFRQLDGGTTRRYSGTGLGLAIVQDFVKLHGGAVWVDDAPEGGARFVVELPSRAPAGSSVDETPPDMEATLALRQEWAPMPAAAAQPGPSEEVEGDRPTVLVVEDHPELREFVADTLSPEFRVVTAADGAEGLDRALRDRPDLIVTDMMMPRMSGDQLLRAVRATPELEAVPVVLLTAKSDEAVRTRLLREGAQDYVAKPFAADELRVRVGNLMALKRGRDVLQLELSGTQRSLEELAREITARNRELETAVESMRVARDHAERAGQVKANFLRLVSHELRTPLTALTLQLQLLQRQQSGALSPSELERVRKMTVAAGRLEDLIESLLEHARMESGRMTVDHSQFDLVDLTRSLVDELQPRAELKQLSLTLTAPECLAEVESDRRLARLIISNLLDNAIKFTQAGKVEVKVGREGDEYFVAVSDSGPGIPRHQHETIFMPFEQLEEISRKHTPGVGLGLALVRQMAEAVGGKIELESEEGTGSVFTLRLPACGA